MYLGNTKEFKILQQALKKIKYKPFFRIDVEPYYKEEILNDKYSNSVVLKIQILVFELDWREQEDYECLEKIVNHTSLINSRTPFEYLNFFSIVGSQFQEEKFIKFVYDQILELEHHEIKEWLTYKDDHIIDPHPLGGFEQIKYPENTWFIKLVRWLSKPIF